MLEAQELNKIPLSELERRFAQLSKAISAVIAFVIEPLEKFDTTNGPERSTKAQRKNMRTRIAHIPDMSCKTICDHIVGPGWEELRVDVASAKRLLDATVSTVLLEILTTLYVLRMIA